MFSSLLAVYGCLLQPFLSVPLSHILPCFGPWEGFQRGTRYGMNGPVDRQDMAYKGQGTITLEEGSANALLGCTGVGDKTVKFQHAGRSPRISKVLEKPFFCVFQVHPELTWADIMTSPISVSLTGGGWTPTLAQRWVAGYPRLAGCLGHNCGMGTLGNVGNTNHKHWSDGKRVMAGGGEHVQLVSSILTAFRSESTMVRICKNLLLRYLGAKKSSSVWLSSGKRLHNDGKSPCYQ